MPTVFRRFFSSGGLAPPDRGGNHRVLRGLLAILRQPSERRRAVLATRLLGRAPFCLALLAEGTISEGGSAEFSITAGRAPGMDLTALGETLRSRLSPLLGMGMDTPRWLDLRDDPFNPGAAFLRKFNLACALMLPVPRRVAGSHAVLLLAACSPLEHQDGTVQEILLGWSILRAAWERGGSFVPAEAAATGDADWPGAAAWRSAPAALALVSGDDVLEANEAARELLESSVGRDGQSWQLWLAAAARRLENGGRDRERLLASRQRQRSLEVALGPALNGGDLRVVAVRDATAEVTADNRHAETISTLSHELRTPLTSMKNSVGLVLRGEAGSLSGQQERFLSLTMRNIDRLDRLIGDLLDVSSAAAGKLALHRQVVDLGSVLREALEMLAATARERLISLDYSGLPAAFPAHVDGDKIVQMLHNTVGNALKYTEEGGVVRVWLRAEDSPPSGLTEELAERFFLPLRVFTLVVEDNGIGMSEEVLRTLFHPFRRGREAEVSRAPGSGLGLHITRALVEAHGGSIDLVSKPDVGTTVWITLPRDPASERVLVGARRLDRVLAETGGVGRLVVLDARRPDRELGEEPQDRAAAAIGEFLARLVEDTDIPVAAAVAASGPGPEGSPGNACGGVVALAEGLWAAVVEDTSRLDPAWEVERARPGTPPLLEETAWQVLELPGPAEPEAAPAEQPGAPARAKDA